MPAKIAATPGSYTGQFLARYYSSHNGKLEEITAAGGSEIEPAANRSTASPNRENGNGSRRSLSESTRKEPKTSKRPSNGKKPVSA
jgi:hypothetical protein